VFLPDLVVRSQRTVLVDAIRPAAVHVRQGKIIGILDFGNVPDGCPLDDATGNVLMPGVVDTHVHIGRRGNSLEAAFEATTRAAAAGGVTTIVDMPFDGAPVTTIAGLEAIRSAARGNCSADVGFWGGIVPDNLDELGALRAAGVRGFACCLGPYGSFPALPDAGLRVAMPMVSKLGVPLLVHAEIPKPAEEAGAPVRAGHAWLSRLRGTRADSQKYSTYLATRPKAAENEAIALILSLCREYRTRLHILHLSSSDALTPIYHARASGLPVTTETCPHYLTFVAEEIPDGATSFRCDPPIRERENREYLWAALAGGLIQMVASDHPHVSSLQLTLPAMWAEANARGYSLNQVAEWMCRAPARLAGFERKGAIDVGFDADFVIWNPDAAVTTNDVHAGRPLRGIVERTYLRGTRAYERGKPMPMPTGNVL